MVKCGSVGLMKNNSLEENPKYERNKPELVIISVCSFKNILLFRIATHRMMFKTKDHDCSTQ